MHNRAFSFCPVILAAAGIQSPDYAPTRSWQQIFGVWTVASHPALSLQHNLHYTQQGPWIPVATRMTAWGSWILTAARITAQNEKALTLMSGGEPGQIRGRPVGEQPINRGKGVLKRISRIRNSDRRGRVWRIVEKSVSPTRCFSCQTRRVGPRSPQQSALFLPAGHPRGCSPRFRATLERSIRRGDSPTPTSGGPPL